MVIAVVMKASIIMVSNTPKTMITKTISGKNLFINKFRLSFKRIMGKNTKEGKSSNKKAFKKRPFSKEKLRLRAPKNDLFSIIIAGRQKIRKVWISAASRKLI